VLATDEVLATIRPCIKQGDPIEEVLNSALPRAMFRTSVLVSDCKDLKRLVMLIGTTLSSVKDTRRQNKEAIRKGRAIQLKKAVAATSIFDPRVLKHRCFVHLFYATTSKEVRLRHLTNLSIS
jgi:hypothetical protein